MATKKGAGALQHSKAGAVFTRLVLETFRLNGRLLLAGDRLTKDIGLTSARWQVLGTLFKAPEPMTVPNIARHMGLHRQSVQRIIDLLAGEGLVALFENPHHKRAKLVKLTTKGLAATRQANRLQIKWANEVTDGLRAADLEAAAEIVRTLRHRLGDRHGAL